MKKVSEDRPPGMDGDAAYAAELLLRAGRLIVAGEMTVEQFAGVLEHAEIVLRPPVTRAMIDAVRARRENLEAGLPQNRGVAGRSKTYIVRLLRQERKMERELARGTK